MATLPTLTVEVKLPFWWKWYLHGCIQFAQLTGLTPDIYKICETIMKRTTVKIVKGDGT